MTCPAAPDIVFPTQPRGIRDVTRDLVEKRRGKTSPESSGAAEASAALILRAEAMLSDATVERPSVVASALSLRLSILFITLVLSGWFVASARRQFQLAEHYENALVVLRTHRAMTHEAAASLLALPPGQQLDLNAASAIGGTIARFAGGGN